MSLLVGTPPRNCSLKSKEKEVPPSIIHFPIVDPNNILMRHKRFLKGLEEAKTKEKVEREMTEQEKQEKMVKFKENAAVQRKKI